MKPKRLVCVVEGRGEVAAIPNLCARIMKHLRVFGWCVDNNPVRQPRSSLVDESLPSPNRPPLATGVSRAITLAVARPADAVVILCDSDDDCAKYWGPPATTLIRKRLPGIAVMAVREYEGWLLHNQDPGKLARHSKKGAEEIRDAKGLMEKFITGYKPTSHQLAQTRAIDIDLVASRSPSFCKFVRSVATLCGVAYECPDRNPSA